MHNNESALGMGIQPDVVVEPTIKDLRQGIDTLLNRAIFTLKEEIEERNFFKS